MSEIRIVYIDDQIDELLSRYINEEYRATPLNVAPGHHVQKICKEVRFEGENGYGSLLNNPEVRAANVILIDNHLFEERTADTGKFSGKQFKVILRKMLPYVEVLIITQDEGLEGDNIIHKFSDRHGADSNSYYREHLNGVVDTAIKEVFEFKALGDDLSQSTDVEKLLVDTIMQSLQGDTSYDALSKNDIDDLISAFKEIKNGCE